MNDDYLWDRSGEPDPEIARLEALLQPYRYEPAARSKFRHQRNVRPLVAAASVVLVLGLGWFVAASTRWEVASLEGSPRIGASAVVSGERFSVGQTVVTDGASRASIRVGRIGEVEVAPRSRVRLLRAWLTDQRIALDRGTIRATISAPPRLFLVETPAGRAVDLGCAYTLQVDEAGFGSLRVTAGWVAYQDGDRESYVPAGAACNTRPGKPPGTPFYWDAPGSLVQALTRLDFETLTAEERAEAIRTIAHGARRADVLTLWHLLGRAAPEERAILFDAIAAQRPEAATNRQEVVDGDRRAIRKLGKALGVRKSGWWDWLSL